MRVISALAAFALFIGVEAAAQTALIGERDTARASGVYTTLTADDASACAALCGEDGICMAWTFRAAKENACDLQAIAAEPVAESGAVSGLSSRAPEFARRLARATASAATAPAPGPAGDPEANDDAAPDGPLALLAAHDSGELLGAPTPSDDLGLRPRIESR